jgi:hypothetical protein
MTELTLNMIQLEAKKASLAVRIANFIQLFAKSPANWISMRIAANLVRDTKFIEHQVTLVKKMDNKQVEDGMAFIQRILPVLVKMERIIAKIENPALGIAFRQHEMAIYKFEAKLHLKQTKHLPVIPTDPLLREALHYATILSIESHL